VPLDEGEHQIGTCGGGGHQSAAQGGPEHRLEGVRIVLDARDDLAAVDTRGTLADVGRFQHHHVPAGLGKMQGGGQPGIAGADDRGLRALRARQRAAHGAGRCGNGPQRLQR
jgi:hypothetical protein